MANILFFHYRAARHGRAILQALKDAGHKVVDAVPEYPDFQPSLELAQPDVVVVEGSQNANRGLEAADFVVGKPAYKDALVLLVNWPEGLVRMAEMKLPQARLVAADEVVPAVEARG